MVDGAKKGTSITKVLSLGFALHSARDYNVMVSISFSSPHRLSEQKEQQREIASRMTEWRGAFRKNYEGLM